MPFILGNKYRGRRHKLHWDAPDYDARKTEIFIRGQGEGYRNLVLTLNNGIIYTGHMANREINPQDV
jgi:hypothetical protein